MRKHITQLASLGLAVLMTGCSASADQHTGEAKGYGGPLKVSVSMHGTDITEVKVTSHAETEGVGTRAIDALPEAIVRADSVEVDNVSGATVTSKAIKEAVRRAIGLEGTLQTPISMDGEATQAPSVMDGVLTGMGMAATGRVGPGKDSDGKQVYSFNAVFASGLFDAEGRILHMAVDQLEVVSPNLGGGNMFSGFPQNTDAEAAMMTEISSWATKRALGEEYALTSGPWRDQMDAYAAMMKGKTVQEVLGWYSAVFDPDTGRPLQEGDKYDALTDGQKKLAAEVVSSATMSLQGEYGNILLAIQRAWEDAQQHRNSMPDGTMVDTNTPTDMTEPDTSMG